MLRRGRRLDPERGQAMVSFALLLTALVAMLGLAIDVGVLHGQHRTAQNAADAAALAAGQLLASSVEDLDVDAGTVYFDVPDEAVYREIRRYAGLGESDVTSSTPTGANLVEGLVPRTRLAATIEYWDGAAWCRSPADPATTDTPSCTLVAGTPPAPEQHRSYKVRVAVSVATASFIPIARISDQSGCVVPAGATGGTTCAHAVVVIQGPCPPCAITYEE